MTRFAANPASLTGRYLSGELRIQMPASRRKRARDAALSCIGARAHNLKKVNVSIPLGMLVCITGVSGSGKSTLVHDVLYNALAREKRPGHRRPKAEVDRVLGAEWIDEVVLVDQSPIGRTPRSNPVTYIKAFDAIRELFASLPESKKRGYAAGTFFLQHSRRALRDLPGRRHGHGRDAVSGRRRADLRGVQRHALQAGGPGGSLSRQEHPRGAEPDGERGAALLLRRAQDRGEAARAGGSRAGLSAAGTIGDHALRRRGAAHEAGGAPATALRDIGRTRA